MARRPQLTNRSMIGALALVSGCLAFSSALAQSFDCKKAVTTVEQAICDDKGLAVLDVQLANDLHNLISAQPELRASYLSNQRLWLRDRDQHCGTQNPGQRLHDCLKAEYVGRITYIARR